MFSGKVYSGCNQWICTLFTIYIIAKTLGASRTRMDSGLWVKMQCIFFFFLLWNITICKRSVVTVPVSPQAFHTLQTASSSRVNPPHHSETADYLGKTWAQGKAGKTLTKARSWVTLSAKNQITSKDWSSATSRQVCDCQQVWRTRR